MQTVVNDLPAIIAGVDEAGRGPLAGPVYAAAVILPEQYNLPGLADSKLLKAAQREKLMLQIQQIAVSWSIAYATVAEIDTLNILQASLLAMRRAVLGLAIQPNLILVDGNRCPTELPCEARAIIKGDRTVAAISAASILAKVARDTEMCRLDIQYPGYAFAVHKGYGTKKHLTTLQALGVTPIHRRSFAPVTKLLMTTE